MNVGRALAYIVLFDAMEFGRKSNAEIVAAGAKGPLHYHELFRERFKTLALGLKRLEPLLDDDDGKVLRGVLNEETGRAKFSIQCPRGHRRNVTITLQGRSIEEWKRIYRDEFKRGARDGAAHTRCDECRRPYMASTIVIEALN